MKDRFKDLETETTLEEKFNLACAAIGANVSDIVSNNISKRHAINRLFVANFLSEYINHGLPEIMRKAPVTVYGMINKVNERRINKDPAILRLDNELSKYVDKWIKSSKKKTNKIIQHGVK